jgi:hypothetical protein
MSRYERGIGEGVDLVNYSWVDPYLKGKKYQGEIKALKGELEGVQKFPRAKVEILEELDGMGDQVKALRVETVRDVFSRYQNGQVSGLSPHVFAQVFINAGSAVVGLGHTAAHDYDSLLAPGIIEAALSELPEGMTGVEKGAKIADLETKIKALEAEIETECWPDSRKVFDDMGRKTNADRWQEVVDHWRKVAAPYNKPVDFHGYAIEQSGPAWEAFRKLGISLVGIETPRPRRH